MKNLLIYLIAGIVLSICSASAQELLKAECTETEDSSGSKGITIRTCTFGDLKSVRTGKASTSGHFQYSYELFKRSGANYVAISVTEILNSNQDKLLDLINRQINLDYTEIQEDPIQAKCAKNIQVPEFDFAKLGFSFDEFGYHFHATLDLNENCESYESVALHLSPNKMKRFLKN